MSRTFSNSITIARVADGASADSIVIETPYDEILRFDTTNDAEEEVVYFSPEYFRFRVYNVNNDTPISNFKWSLYYLNNNQEYEFIAEKGNLNGFDSAFMHTLPSSDAEQAKAINDDYTQLYLGTLEFYENLQNREDFSYLKRIIDGGSAFFKFVYLVNNESKAIKYFAIKNGVSSDMAKLNIGANSINMAIRDSSLKFSANGLALQNGDFIISDANGEKIFYTDDLGNLTLKGNIYAEEGTFRGDVYANSGYFNGTINAFDGTIGGFNIVSKYYEPMEVEEEQSKEGLYFLLDEHPIIYKQIIVSGSDKYIQLTYENRKYYYRVYINKFEDDKTYYTYDLNNGYTEASEYNSNETYYLSFGNLNYYNTLEDITPAYPVKGQEYYVKINSFNISTYYTNLGPRLFSANNEIILDGSNGNIIAQNIDLGAGARITDKIVFSSDGENIIAALYNPELHDGQILQSANVFLNNEGRLFLGTLELYGGTGNADGYMRSVAIDKNSQYQNGEWRINEDGTAYFNNIYADNAHIQNSILEINTVQSVGSTMIFKDSWTITNIVNSTFEEKEVYEATLDGLANLGTDDYFMTNNNNFYQVLDIRNTQDNQKSIIVFQGDSNISKGSIITKFGKSYQIYVQEELTEPLPGRHYYELTKEGEYVLTEDAKFNPEKQYYYKSNESPDCIISIRGESSIKEAGSSYASGNALTISSFTRNNNVNTYTKHLILGDLSDSGIDDLTDIKGYGLYADNVYLNGSLIAKNLDSGYCGINTLSKVEFTKKPEIDISPIIFWGGSQSKSSTEIQEAPFQVTANGTLFCRNAIIENSLFTGEIRTAKIYGTGTEELPEPALSILDANKGISFKKTETVMVEDKEEINEIELFTIGDSGFYIQDQPFINFGKSGLFNTDSDNDSDLPITTIFTGELHGETNGLTAIHSGLGIHFGNSISLIQNLDMGTPDAESDTDYTSQLLVNFKNQNGEEKSSMVFENNKNINQVKTYFNKEVYKGRKTDGNYFMEYKPSFDENNEINGYDIFIY